ncbi:hypothetical protein CMI37_33170 [Candidatus Pacearchaeota archaeon]|nr:hypothetical protein [Candidatus Pacearchaeota archaeon]
MTRGTFGETRVWDDFLGPDNDLTWGAGTIKIGNFGFVSVNEGTYEWTIDEPGGIVAFTTDTGDNDNCALFAGTFQPSLGGCETEWRVKFNSATLGAVYIGFSETLALATPVMPAEFDTVTMTYNGSGGMMGANLDTDATTNDFRMVGGDGGAVSGNADANGTRANETITADEWYIVRTEINPDGGGQVYVGHKGDQLDLITTSDAVHGTSFAGAIVTATDQQYAVCMFENRSAAARVFEVDYGFARGWRDWTNT